MRFKLLTLGIGLLWSASPKQAFADPLALVAVDPKGIVVADLDVQDRETGHPLIWEIQLLVKPVLVGGKAVPVLKTQLKIDCERRTAQRVYIIGQYVAGDYSNGEFFTERAAPVVPGTHLTDVLRIACDGQSSVDVIFDDMAHAKRTLEDARAKGLLKN